MCKLLNYRGNNGRYFTLYIRIVVTIYSVGMPISTLNFPPNTYFKTLNTMVKLNAYQYYKGFVLP